MSSVNQSHSIGAVSTAQWKELSVAPYGNTVTLPYSNPPVIIGGSDKGKIKAYEVTKYSWRKVDSLTGARYCVGVGLINHSTIIVIGGTSGSGVEGAKASSLTTEEIGNIVPNQ